MARLSIFLLGSFRVALDGEPVTGFESDKVRALLAFLAVEAERSHRRETLVGLLWPEYPERSARASLRNALANLRQVIGDREADPPFLCIARQTIQFNPEGNAQVDVRTFTEGLVPADASPASRPETIHELEAAVALYQGGFLEGFSLPDSSAFEEWALLKREQFQRQALAALGRLADHYERRGEYERALRFAWRRVEADPYRGVAQRGLMRLLALSGQREAALAQYETFRSLLAEEMGVAPAEETARLCQQIQAGELAPPAPVPRIAPRHNLPAQSTPFIGRENELVAIKARLSDPDCRLLTLIGPGGSGKTRLALEAAAAQVDSFKHGVFFVSLAPLRSVDAIVPTVAEALGFSFYEGGEPRQQLLDYLRQKSMLIIMDNFEHLLSPPFIPPAGGERGGADLVSDILTTAPDVKTLTTSRARLNVEGEHRFRVGGMHFPESPLEAATDASQYSAVELFLQGARRAQPSFELTDENLGGVVQVCRLVDGMPLGILLAAAWVEMLMPEEIAAEISRSIDFLATEGRDVPARQRSMRATLNHSWHLLTEREREVFRALSVFRGGFTQEAAQRVTGASLRELLALVNRSLLHRAPTGRYEVHELLRQYAEEKLDQEPAAGKAARDQHCSYYTAALQQWEADLKGPRQQAALAEMGAEIENARAAWDWATERGRIERLDQALEGLCEFYWAHWRIYEAEAACRTAAEHLATTASADELRVLARILARQAGFSKFTLMDRTEVNQLLRQSLALLEGPALTDQDTRREKAFVLLEMACTAADFDSDWEQGRKFAEQSLALYRAVGDRQGTALLLGHLAWLVLGSGDEAKRLAEESLAIERALGNPARIANSLMNLGSIALSLGQLEEAERLLREGVAIYRETRGRGEIAIGLWRAGRELVWLGRFDEAHSLLEESLAIFDDLGIRWHTAISNVWLGYVKVHLGEYGRARAQSQMELAFFQECGDPYGIGFSLFALGSVALAEEAYAEAWQFLEESIPVFRQKGRRDEMGRALAALGYAARGLGQLPQARQHLYEALRTVADIGTFLPFVLSLPAVALLLADRGEKELAVELYALASRYPLAANSRWFEDVAGRHIAAIAATLPLEVVAARQERGRARDLDATVAELLVELEGKSTSDVGIHGDERADE